MDSVAARVHTAQASNALSSRTNGMLPASSRMLRRGMAGRRARMRSMHRQAAAAALKPMHGAAAAGAAAAPAHHR